MAISTRQEFPALRAIVRPLADATAAQWRARAEALGYTIISRSEKLGRRAHTICRGDARLQVVQWPETPQPLVFHEPEPEQVRIARDLMGCGLLDEPAADRHAV